MIKAAILDLDGLMVQTQPLGLQAWQRCMQPAGFRLADHHYQHLIGLGQQEAVEYLLKESGAPWMPDQLLENFWEDLFVVVNETDLQPMPGLMVVLGILSTAGVPLGVASNSPTAYIEHVVGRLGITPYFNVILGAESASRAKPAPHIYLEAARRLGADPARCLAFEDSPSGRTAALAAGMRCVFVPNPDLGLHHTVDASRDEFRSLEECAALLDSLV